MSIKEIVVKFVEEAVQETDYYIVDIIVSESKIKRKVTIYLDSDEGITIDQCTQFSRNLGNTLEEHIEGAFTLEVSSPGADSPLKFERQYVKNIGRTLKVNLLDGTELKGQLTEVNNGTITILPEAKKKVNTEATTIQLDQVKEAKVVISFK